MVAHQLRKLIFKCRNHLQLSEIMSAILPQRNKCKPSSRCSASDWILAVSTTPKTSQHTTRRLGRPITEASRRTTTEASRRTTTALYPTQCKRYKQSAIGSTADPGTSTVPTELPVLATLFFRSRHESESQLSCGIARQSLFFTHS